MFGKEILKLALYFYLFIHFECQLYNDNYTVKRNTWQKGKSQQFLNRCNRQKYENCSSFSHNCLLMSQKQNSLLITEDDVNDGNSCSGALLARVNGIIMKLFQWCCCFKRTLKNWFFWGLQSVFFWLPVDSVDILMGFKVIPYPFQFHNFRWNRMSNMKINYHSRIWGQYVF